MLAGRYHSRPTLPRAPTQRTRVLHKRHRLSGTSRPHVSSFLPERFFSAKTKSFLFLVFSPKATVFPCTRLWPSKTSHMQVIVSTEEFVSRVRVTAELLNKSLVVLENKGFRTPSVRRKGAYCRDGVSFREPKHVVQYMSVLFPTTTPNSVCARYARAVCLCACFMCKNPARDAKASLLLQGLGSFSGHVAVHKEIEFSSDRMNIWKELLLSDMFGRIPALILYTSGSTGRPKVQHFRTSNLSAATEIQHAKSQISPQWIWVLVCHRRNYWITGCGSHVRKPGYAHERHDADMGMEL